MDHYIQKPTLPHSMNFRKVLDFGLLSRFQIDLLQTTGFFCDKSLASRKKIHCPGILKFLNNLDQIDFCPKKIGKNEYK